MLSYDAQTGIPEGLSRSEPSSMRKSSLRRGVSRSAGFHSDCEYLHSLESVTCSIHRKHQYSVVARTNEHGIPAIPPDPLVESAPFCVSVLYPNRAQPRSVENEMPQAYCVKCKT